MSVAEEIFREFYRVLESIQEVPSNLIEAMKQNQEANQDFSEDNLKSLIQKAFTNER